MSWRWWLQVISIDSSSDSPSVYQLGLMNVSPEVEMVEPDLNNPLNVLNPLNDEAGLIRQIRVIGQDCSSRLKKLVLIL